MTWALRIVVAVALLGSALTHYLLWQDGFKDIDIIGPLFLVNVVAGVVIAIAMVRWSHWLVELLAIGFGAVTLGGYLISLTVGLFGVREQFQTQAEVWAMVTEVVCIVLGAVLLIRRPNLVGTVRGDLQKVLKRGAGRSQ
ncbi:hypothetical protein [Amycolatopsis nigrescens]|uniref:hypothetical protein n=1 Tax=Amycolatopsis nigrescens TaxID=381445 RepID=UPI00039DBDA9|nr:hypothetical protein [Amycolatopsis nigrescens]